MGSPDTKIKKLSLAFFRGAKNLINLDLGSDCKSTVIFGNNGEGKSTFAQAIEWFYREKIDVLLGEGIEKKDIVNLSAEATDETSVDIVFNKKELNASKIFLNEKIKCSNTSSEFTDYINNKVSYDRIYLNQSSILWLLAKTKGEKRVEIAKIIGYEDVVTVKKTIASVLRDLEKSTELSDLKARIADNDGVMTREIYGEAITSVPALLEKSSIFLKTLGVNDSLASLDDLEKAITKSMQFVPNEAKAKQSISLTNLQNKINFFETKLNRLNSVKTWQDKYNPLVADKETLANLALSDFLETAEKIVEGNKDLKNCPLCEQEISDRDLLLNSIVERYKKYLSLRTQLETVKTELNTLKDSLQSVERDFTELINSIKENNLSYETSVFDSFQKRFKDLPAYLLGRFNLRAKSLVDIEKNETLIAEIKEKLEAIKVQIKSEIEKLTFTKDEKEKQNAFQKLMHGKDIVSSNLKNRKIVKSYDEQIKEMRIIDNQLLDLQNKTLEEALKILSEDINRFFCFLNKKEKVKNVRLELKGEEGIEFNLDFYGRTASPPKKFLSESQQNSLGISLFLAAVKKFNKVNKFFVLDDVLISFDRYYRTRLLDLLETEFSDYQVFLLTHENYWFQIIKRKFPNWVLKEVAWSFENGVTFRDDHPDWLKNIGVKHAKGEKVGNELRIEMERLLKDLCQNLEVKLPYRSGDENEQRMIGELFPYISSTLKGKKSSLIENQEYKSLEMSNFIMTCSSHDKPDFDSSGDIGDTIDKIEKFRNLFYCPNGESIKKSIRLPGQDRISCKCGQLTIDWEE